MTDGFDRIFSGSTLIAVLRGMDVETTVSLARAAWDIGIETVEVTIQTPEAVRALRRTIDEGHDRGKVVGAGTVTTAEAMHAAVSAGAAFTVSPALDLALLDAHRNAGILHLPGVATPSEVLQVTMRGQTWMKAFPAASLGPNWFTAIQGPFPEVRFVATGGIRPSDVSAYLSAGAAVVGIGGALGSPQGLTELRAVLGT